MLGRARDARFKKSKAMALDVLQRLADQRAMIEQLAADSRRCVPGTAFFAYPGEAADGRRYVADALARGASAVVWESEGFAWDPKWQVPNVGVAGLKQQAGSIAHAFYGRPSETLWVCGVTGTNGKTSCTQWIAAALDALGMRSGVIGTLGCGFPGALSGAQNTTPDVLALHAMLAEMKRAGACAVAMEASSHGLAQGRTNAVAFDCALFTNLSHEHLDYHGSMDAYGAAKALLFEAPTLAAAVLNLDDVAGVRLAERARAGGLRTIGYSLMASSPVPGIVDQYLAARSIAFDGEAMQVRLTSSWGEADIALPHVGRFNVSNALGVLGCLLAYGVGFDAAIERLAALPPVAGRMQALGGAGVPLVVVDYAHTPDALEKVLHALRPVAEARGGALVAVFGAGGERDAAKRPLMGAVAGRLADRVVLTSDNPRGEDPHAILEAIRAGVGGASLLEPDRARAIAAAIDAATPQDVVLIAGKGHERTQEIAGEHRPFSDTDVARLALAALAARGPA
jgi:UDP-N-acetylmuramoyl-L-alanyl-D-glutamate--2,6-diaminopimelate ligase